MEHPGKILMKKITECAMPRKELALRTGVTEKHICTILNGERGISTSFARKLGYVFNTAKYWLEQQASYDEYQTRLQEENNISKNEIAILKPLHEIVEHFMEKGYLHNDCGDASKVMQLRELLNISDLTIIPKITYNAAYRAQLSDNVKVNPYVLFAWQRLCEKSTEKMPIKRTIDKDLLLKRIPAIKALMFDKISNGIKEMQNIFSECGIAFQVVKNFRGAPVQGFIKDTQDNQLILCLTIRRKRADVFWFTLFHEIGHILNNDYSTRFVDFDSISGKAEDKANRFARDILIEPNAYRHFIQSHEEISWKAIADFAKEIHIMPFIVLGRLQNDGILDWSDYPCEVRKYSWA